MAWPPPPIAADKAPGPPDDEFEHPDHHNELANAINDTVTEFTSGPTGLKIAGIEAGAQVNTVDSVNGATGVVVLDADDIDDTATTNKFATAAQLSAVDGLATTYQPLDADLTTLAAGNIPTNLNASLASHYQPLDADILKADTADTLTAGFDSSVYAAGTKSSGTYTPAASDGNFQVATNGGAHTLAPPATSCAIVIHYTNNGSAGTITTSGFTVVDGDSFTTTDTHEFLVYVTKINDVSHLNVVALQ
jgi:hypothetical protein